jgi:hypothetical protein
MQVLLFLLIVFLGCSGSERMEALYAQRCFGCHGPSGKGDGPVAEKLPVSVPDFRNTVKTRTVTGIRRIITDGKGMMPAFGPALQGREIQDMVFFVRILSQQGRSLAWWEKYEPLVWAHCSVPWEYVFGDGAEPGDETPAPAQEGRSSGLK